MYIISEKKLLMFSAVTLFTFRKLTDIFFEFPKKNISKLYVSVKKISC